MTTQVPVPAHPAPVQPSNTLPGAASAVSVTTVPSGKLAVHVPGHAMPGGVEETPPVPFPDRLTVSGNVCVSNVAVTDCAAFIVTTQLPVPVQAPLQPVNVDPVAGVAVSVTTLPCV